MVWKDVTIGFTIAGVIATFVPQSFFQWLFIGQGVESASFSDVLWQTTIGPVAAFFTFIGSMGNIPLSAVLFSNEVSFAGIIAFIFSDLVVFPVVRIQAKYYGWKMALYLVAILLFVLISTAIVLHYGFSFVGLLPDPESAKKITKRNFFKIDYKLFFNITFITLSIGFVWWHLRNKKDGSKSRNSNLTEKILYAGAVLAFCWIGGGILVAV